MIHLLRVDIRRKRDAEEQKISFSPPLRFDDDKQLADFVERVRWIMNYTLVGECDYVPTCEYVPGIIKE